MYQTLIASIRQSILDYEREKHLQKIWKAPLAALVSVSDPGIALLPKAVSETHLMPADVLPGAKSIISFFIPFDESIITSNLHGDLASREWAEAYILTNDMIRRIGSGLETVLETAGYHAGKIPATHNFDEERLISDWSHRHIAYIAGLGSFGINNMLITDKGCCGRFGSLVTDLPLPDPADPGGNAAKTKTVQERCLNKRKGSCGVCQKKCPAGAYAADGTFDPKRCYNQCLKNAELFRDIGLADVCGKCLVGLPCSTMTPAP